MRDKLIRPILLFALSLATVTSFGQMRMIPHLTRAGGGFTTTVIVQNRSVDAVTYTLIPYDQSGNALDRVTRTVGGQVSESFPATDISSDASHFLIEGDASINVTAAYASTSGGSPAHVEETDVSSQNYRLFAGDWSVVFDGFAAVNMGDEAADVMVAQKNASGTIREVVAVAGLAPNAKGLFIIGDPSGSQFEAQDGVYYEISSAQNLAITALRGDVPGRDFLWTNEAAPEGFAQPDNQRMIAHLTRAGGGFSSTIIVENLSGDETSYTLEPYAQDGSALDPVTRTVAGSALDTFPATDLGETASHLVIQNAENVKVTVTYASAAGGSPVHVAETTPSATSYRLFTGDWSTIFDGLAVVNTGNRGEHTPADKQKEAVDVWVVQRDASGNIIQAVRAIDDLAYMAKGLFIIGDPNTSVFQPVDGAYYEVYAKQSLAITALRGNIPGSTFLWANRANPKSRAEIYRDDMGVWFIEGGSLYDVIEAQAYSVTEDRLFQMELFRRNARGRLADLFGRNFLNTDIFNLRQNYTEEELQTYYDNLSPDAKTMVKAYRDGLNRRGFELFADQSMIPLEILVLNFIPGPWSPTDVLAVTSSILRQFDPNDWGSGQLENAAVRRLFREAYPDTAEDMFEDFFWLNDPDATAMIPAGTAKTRATKGDTPNRGTFRDDIDVAKVARIHRETLDERERLLRSIGAFTKMGSYAWAVSGDKTASGNPMLYSGPQTGFAAPVLMVEGSIRGDDLTISGMAIPGTPGIIIGRTPHHAWSMQVGHAHTADVYVEPFSILSGPPHRTETISVANENPITLDVFRSEHGPIVQIDVPSETAIAWKYAHWGNEFDSFQGFLELARAQSIEDFTAGIDKVGVSQHFCYVDKDGNIAYWLSGRDPNRPAGEWRLPQGLLTDDTGQPIVLEYDIDNYRARPHDENNARGFYAGWNNKAAVDYDGIPYGGTAQSGIFDRANFVVAGLQALVDRGNVTYEEVRGFALNIATTDSFGGGGNPWVEIGESFRDAVENAGPDQQQTEALEIMAGWDGHFVEGGPSQWVFGPHRSDGYMLMNTWTRNVLASVFDEFDEPDGFPFDLNLNRVLGFNVILHGILDDATLENRYDWFVSRDENAAQSFEDHVVQGLNDALTTLGARPWGTNRRGFISYPHPLLSQFGIPTFHSQTPYSSRSTYAHCVEYGSNGPIRIESMFPLGQSGYAQSNPNDPDCNESQLLGALGAGICFDPNTRSMIELYDSFTHRVFPLFE